MLVAYPPTPDLSDLLLSIELKLHQLGWVQVSRDGNYRHVIIQEPRLIEWAIVACSRSPHPINITGLLDKTVPEKHWWLLRQVLPEMALRVLDDKLTLYLEQEIDHHADG